MLDARAWLIWALTLLLVASSTRNPLYLVLILLSCMVVERACTPPRSRGAAAALRFALVAVPLAALFNALTVHLGETILFRLPDGLPLVGGPITVEAMAFGATNGLTLTVIVTAFGAFNQGTTTRDLVRLTPRAFHASGVVMSIALTFIPQTTRSLKRIREAQAVRGHRVRGLRDWLPIFVPLLVSGLERAIGLAEAMVARGYGATGERRHPVRTLLAVVVGLVLVLLGWLAYLFFPAWRPLALAALLGGVAIVAALIAIIGRSVPHTTLRERRWTVREGLVFLGCALPFVVYGAPLALAGRETLHYSPYPRLTLPRFNPFFGLATLGLLVPGLTAILTRSPEHD